MHNAEEHERVRNLFQQAESVANAAQDSANFAEGPFTITFRDVDLPCYIWDGVVYVQIPLAGFLDAFTATATELLRDLESGISEAGSAALSSDDFRRQLSRVRVAEFGVVRNSGEQR